MDSQHLMKLQRHANTQRQCFKLPKNRDKLVIPWIFKFKWGRNTAWVLKKMGVLLGWVWFEIEIWIYTSVGSGKKGFVDVLVTKVVPFFQEIKNKWISTHTETVCLMGCSQGEQKQRDWPRLEDTLSAITESHCIPQHLLHDWLEYRLQPLVCTGKKNNNHLLTQISYTWIMRLITPIPSPKQITSATKSAQP